MCEAVPFATLDSENCILSVNATTATLVLYAAAIQIEDFSSNSSIQTSFSSVPLQFIISIEHSDSNCTTSPSIIGELPTSACLVANL